MWYKREAMSTQVQIARSRRVTQTDILHQLASIIEAENGEKEYLPHATQFGEIDIRRPQN